MAAWGLHNITVGYRGFVCGVVPSQTGWGYPHWPGLLKHMGSDDLLAEKQ